MRNTEIVQKNALFDKKIDVWARIIRKNVNFAKIFGRNAFRLSPLGRRNKIVEILKIR